MKVLQKLRKNLLNILFPINCFSCGKSGYYLCPACVKKIDRHTNRGCFFCKNPTLSGEICLACREKKSLDKILSFCYYSDPKIQKIIQEIKYNSVFLATRDISHLIAQLIFENKKKYSPLNSLLVPVPMYPRKERRRGFNQTILLAETVSKITKIPVALNLLKKTVATHSQMKIKQKTKRLLNLKNSFVVNNRSISPLLFRKKILLIDDVITTGATFISCSYVLKRAGFKEIIGLTVAAQTIKI